jgi:hypothetical protein
MARGNVLPERMKALIAQVYLEHKDWRTRKIREEVIRRWHQASRNYDDPNWPGLSAVQKILAEYRKRDAEKIPESEELDKPWSTMSLVKYPIPPEALPSVLQVWVWARENMDSKFTIRQAQWAARLYAVIKDIPLLALLSNEHCKFELILKLVGKSVIEEPVNGVDLAIFQEMTGQEITPERKKKILRLSDEEWLAHEELDRYIDKVGFDEIDQRLLDQLYQKYVKPKDPGAQPIILKKREAKNERTHNKEG